MRRAFVLAIAALLISVGARAQSDTSSDADSIGPVFRGVIDSVAAVAGYGSLRDGGLSSGTRREVRVYIGFGLGYPQEAARLWEDSRSAHGWLGLWWPGTRLDYTVPDGTAEDYAEARKERSEWVALVRESAKKSGCREFHRQPGYEMCTFPAERVDWAAVLRNLDSLGITRLPQQRADLLGLDGVTLVVEYRDAAGYRAYYYWTPRVDAEDANERAAARIMESIKALFHLADIETTERGRRAVCRALYVASAVGASRRLARSERRLYRLAAAVP